MTTTSKVLPTLGIVGLFTLASASGCLVVNDVGNDHDSLGGTSNSGGGSSETGGRESQGSGGDAGDAGQGGANGGTSGGEVGGVGAAGGAGGAGGEVFSFSSVTINSSAQSGEIQLSGQLGIAEGMLAMVLSSIKDPEDPTRPVDPANVSFTVTIDGEEVECDIDPTGEITRAAVDLVFINDTTGSMEGAVNGIADSISDFAADVDARGVDARFAMITYGDEFSTMTEGETDFTVGQAEYTAGYDIKSRPYVDFQGLSRFQRFLQELQDSDDLGEEGGDSPENTLGALQYAIDTLSWQSNAARVFVVIGDNPAHTVDTASSSWTDEQLPPVVDDLLTTLDGTAVTHVVGHDSGVDPYVNLKDLSDATGGAFIELPTDGVVDLTSMSLNNWVSSTYFGVCFGIEPVDAERTLRIQATVTGADEHTGRVTYEITLE